MRRTFTALAMVCLWGEARAHDTQIFEVSPGEDWCATVNEVAMPGDIIRLAPGDYPGPCAISRTPPEEQDEYTMVMSQDPANPARIVHDGESDFLITLEGDQLMLLSLEFGEVPEGMIPVEIIGTREIWLRYNRFGANAGTAVKVSGPVEGLHLLDNEFDGVALPFDLELGAGASWVDVGDNRIREAEIGVRATGEWRGWIRNNVLWDVTQGALVEAGGSLDVRGNWIRFEQQGLDLVAAEAQIEANILHGEGQGLAIGSEETPGTYAVLGNSLVTETEPGIRIRGSAETVGTLRNLSLPAIDGVGNVECETRDSCWENVDEQSYYPVRIPESDEAASGLSLGEDFCGRPRSQTPWAGGLEAACPGDPERFEFDFKRNFQCPFADLSGDGESCHDAEMEDTGDTGGVGDTGNGPDAGEACGCQETQRRASGPWLLVLVGAAVLRRVQLRSRSTSAT